MHNRLFQSVADSAAFLAGRSGGNFLPQEVIFEATTACNLACPMCARTHLARPRPVQSVTLEQFERYVQAIPQQVARVAIAGLGEPLLVPHLPEMVAAVTRRGFSCALYTNATLLTPPVSRKLLEAGLRSVIIPLDGATARTYEQNRRGARLAEVVDNVSYLLQLKTQLSFPLFVELQMLRLPNTRGEEDQWRRMWDRPGVDSLRIKPDHMGVAEERTLAQKGICAMPWRGPATVDVEGQVYPCCVQSPENVILGNLGHDNLATLWNGPRAVALRQAFVQQRRKQPTCSGCQIPLPPRPVAAAGNLVDPFTARRVLSVVEARIPWLLGGK